MGALIMNTAAACNLLTDSNRKIRELLWVLEGDDYDYTLENFKLALDNCNKVWLILHHTRGVWLAADYSYKAREICNQAWTLLDRYLCRLSGRVGGRSPVTRLRGATGDRYRSLRESLRVLEFQFHEDECERLGSKVDTLTGAGNL
jgi:hypothetical protein